VAEARAVLVVLLERRCVGTAFQEVGHLLFGVLNSRKPSEKLRPFALMSLSS
jgi:hypothetical protein